MKLFHYFGAPFMRAKPSIIKFATFIIAVLNTYTNRHKLWWGAMDCNFHLAITCYNRLSYCNAPETYDFYIGTGKHPKTLPRIDNITRMS